MNDSQMNAAPGADLTILIADDHWVVRETLKQVARSLNEGFQIIEASSFDEVLATLERTPTVGLLLIDLIMPGFDEFAGLNLLRGRYPAIPVVIVSIHEDPDHVIQAIQHGVIGYIPKSASAEEIKLALTRVISGEVSFPRGIISRTRPASSETTAPNPRHQSSRIGGLTNREREILAMLGRGMGLQDIADALVISRQTVRVHLGNAMKKLAIHTREAAIGFAIQNVAALSVHAEP